MRRQVYLVTDGDHWRVFGTMRRAQRYVESLGVYKLDENQPAPQGKSVHFVCVFYENPKDPDDQQTIYKVPVR